MMAGRLRIGCAGWAIPERRAASFPTSGSRLERYAQRFTAVEINSSFHRSHRRATYERWSAMVPDDFDFSVKAPKEITHSLRLVGAEAALDAFLEEAAGLGGKLGPLLFQLPPSLAFEKQEVTSFLTALRSRFEESVVCEPRHASWFTMQAGELLKRFRIGFVAADPPVAGVTALPDGWDALAYLRLHGSPHVYYSEYRPGQIEQFAQQLIALRSDRQVWCIFDNTAAGAAIGNALALQERVAGSITPPAR